MRRWCGLLVSVLLLLSVAGPASASPVARSSPLPASDALLKTSVGWTAAPSGPALIWDATAFAASTGELVQFGGTTGYATPTSTRLFNPTSGTWTTLGAPKRGWPVARTLARMAWDPVHARVILFGGRDLAGVPLQDTWSFEPKTRTWTRLVASCRTALCPPARFAHGMVWSSALSRMVVFGGAAGSPAVPFLGDVWTFDGTAWAKLVTTGAPAARELFGMAEDASTGRILVFGGLSTNTGVVTDTATWLLNPATRAWQRIATATVPAPRDEVGMAWVASVGAVVIATGGDGTTCMSWTNTVWAFDAAAGNWRQLATTGGSPTPRNEGSLTANPLTGGAILIGGTGDNQLPITLVDRAWIVR